MTERLLTALRAAVRDLVDKRLWPVAVALLVALVAVPVVIGSSSPDVPPPVAAQPPAAAAATTAAIAVADPAVVGRARPGAVNDPFYDPPAPKSAATSFASPVAPSGAGARAAAAPAPRAAPASRVPSPARRGAPGAPTPAAARPSAPAARAGSSAGTAAQRTLFRTRLRWGPDADADVRGVSRLQPLGGLSNPSLLYLGTTANGKRAVFLLGPRADSRGDGRCAETSCRVIALRSGDRRTVEVRGEDGGEQRRFTLVVDGIVRRVVATRSQALALRARVHPHGRDALRAMIKDRPTAAAIGQFAYDRTMGAVVATTAP